MVGLRWLLGLAVASALLAGCGPGAASSRTFVGPVTETEPSVCVGATAATGECFVKDDVTKGLRVGQCVQVTYPAGQQETPGPFSATAVSLEDATAHPSECPAG